MNQTARYWVVIPAAGGGSRMGMPRPKQYLPLRGRALLEWSIAPFLDTDWIDGVVMVLAKSDLAIAARYAQLLPARALRERIFNQISAEHGRTIAMLRLLTQRELLADNPALQASLRERFAYIDPLNYLQIDLIRRYRAAQQDGATEPDKRVRSAIHLTINGISAGLRNSG